MRVLWITYGMFPEVTSHILGNKNIKGSGGWLLGAANGLTKHTDINLKIAIVNRAIKQRESFDGELMSYELIPFGRGFDHYHTGYDEIWREIKKRYSPDIVHIHGIESTLALSYMKACGNENTVISIQGIAGIIARYYYDGLTTKDIIRNITFRDLLTRKTLFSYKKDFQRRGLFECETLRHAKNIIGRTTWDKVHTWTINPDLNYHFCNETLRNEFYNHQWEYKKCKPYTIFASQGSAPFKGLHFLIKAFPLVKKYFPEAKLIISGTPLAKTKIEKYKQTGYQKYLSSLIKKYDCGESITFTGPLDEQEMVKQYLSSNVFVCPSTIENSSNSVAEAQILGVPLIASYTGGIPDMIPNERTGIMIRVGEYEMLAKTIVDIFTNSRDFDNTEMRKLAASRHNPDINFNRTLEIYKKIIRGK